MQKGTINYYGVYEGLQEEKYLKHLQSLINQNKDAVKRVNFRFSSSNGGGPLYIVQRSLKSATFANQKELIKNQKIVAIFDFDFKQDFIEALQYGEKHSIVLGYSNVNFDLWLLLHKKNFQKKITKTNGYEKELRRVYHLENGHNIKTEENIEKILSQITLEDVKMAITNAKKIEKFHVETKDYISSLTNHYEQPYIKLYEFIETVLKDVGL